MMNRYTWVFVLFTALPIRPLGAQHPVATDTHSAASKNFEVQSFASGPEALKVIELCESLRAELARVWGGGEVPSNWTPRCSIAVHPTRASYLSVVGPDGGQTSGCSLIQLDADTVVGRRIDLLVETSGAFHALPHELTHVVLADRFRGRQPPHWLDEGIAMLADTDEKQSLHDRDCRAALQGGTAFSVGEILHLQQFSSPDQMPAFYGQSLSLVRMLSERDNPEKLIPFALEAQSSGFESALKRHYSINSIGDLQRAWQKYALGGASLTAGTPIVTISFKP